MSSSIVMQLKYPLFSLFISFIFSFVAHAQQVNVDPFFNQGSGANGTVLSSVLLPGARAVIAGSFTNYNGYSANRIARLNPDGTFDPSFRTGTGFNGTVNKIILQKDGKLIAVGNFTSFNGQNTGCIIRLNADGSRDISFNIGAGANAEIRDVILTQDDHILAAGDFVFFNNQASTRFVKLRLDGSIDTNFQSSASGSVRALHENSDGSILVGGSFNFINQQSRPNIALVAANGQLLEAFQSTQVNGTIRKIKSFDASTYWISGDFSNWNGAAVPQLVKVNPDGTLSNTFEIVQDLDGIIHDFIQANDTLLLLGGAFQNLDTLHARGLLGLNLSGARDTNFTLQTNAGGQVWHLQTTVDQALFIAGNYNQLGGVSRRGFAKAGISNEVLLDYNPGFGISSTGNVTALARQADGKILIAGNFTSYHHQAVPRLFRLNVDGTIDTSFNIGTNPNNNILKILVQSDGKIIAVGEFTNFNGLSTNRIIRLNPDGSRDDSFIIGNGANNAVRTAALTADGSIIIAGNFTNYSGTARNRIAKILENGAIDPTFAPGTGFNNTVNDIVILSDGRIAAGGTFQNFNGVGRNRLAIIQPDGSLDQSFDASGGANNTVQRIALQPDGKLLITGSFTAYDDTQRLRFARVNTDGSLDQSFVPNASIPSGSVINGMHILPDGTIMIVGTFATYNNFIANRIARINSNGSVATQIYGSGADNSIQEMLVYDGGFIIAGLFTSFREVNRGGLARISGCVLPNLLINNPVCEGADLVLNASGTSLSYQWNGPEGFAANENNSIIANIASHNAGYYQLRTEPTAGCFHRSRFYVQVDTLFDISATHNTPVCEGEQILLSAMDEGVFQWSGPNNFSATGKIVQIPDALPGMSGLYELNSQRFACNSQASVSVTVYEKPEINISVNSPVCEGSNANFSSTAGYSYLWSGPEGFVSNLQSPTFVATSDEEGIYSLIVTDAQGCVNTDSVQLDIIETPDATASNNGPVCIGEGVLLAAFGGETFSWIGPNGFNANSQTVVFTAIQQAQAGTYIATVTGSNGCSVQVESILEIDECTGIAELQGGAEWELFPNPASHSLFVKGLGKGESLSVLDLQGRVKIRRMAFDPIQQIDLSALQDGFYILLIDGKAKKFQVLK